MDFHKSIEDICEKIKNLNLFFKMGKNDLSIIVENKYEIILTHYPLWDNEKFLYMIGSIENKTIIREHIPENIIIEIFINIKNESYSIHPQKKILN